MKRTLLLTGAIVASLAVNAQVQRTCLAEGFSNASCGPCASQNPAYNTLLSGNTAKVIAIKYQTNWPGTDPMNAQTQTQVGPRVTYYSVSGVPWGALDGTAYAGASYSGALANLDQTEIDARYATSSAFSMNTTHSFSSDYDSIFVTVDVTTPASFTGTTMRLHVNLVEKDITFAAAPGSNGETEFHSVFRDSYTTTSGQTIPNAWAAGENHVYTFAKAIPNYIYDITELAIVAFIQDNNDKQVHQASKSNPIGIANYGITQNIGNLSAFSCGTDYNGVTTNLKNVGSVAITSATVNYQLDGGTVLTAPFSGSIAAGGNTNFTLPNITGVAGGAHTLETWMSNINGSPLTDAIAADYGTASKAFTNITAANGTPGPITQNFAVSTFPYANWALDNPNPSQKWTRVTTNTGSMKFDNYNYPAGSTSSMIVEPVDLTGLTSPSLKFDVAYCQYSSESDALEVFVSTNCGSTWTSVYSKAGSTLSTKPAQTSAFTPTAAQWRTETVDLTPYASANKLFIRYAATSDYGNNLYVDNINISSPSSIEDNATSSFKVYPNPTTDFINVNFENAENITVSLINAMGQTVKIFNNVNNNTQLSLEGLATGVYVLNADINGARVSKQIIKN